MRGGVVLGLVVVALTAACSDDASDEQVAPATSTSVATTAERAPVLPPEECRATWRPTADGVSVFVDTGSPGQFTVSTTLEGGGPGPARELTLLQPADGLEVVLTSDQRITGVDLAGQARTCVVAAAGDG